MAKSAYTKGEASLSEVALPISSLRVKGTHMKRSAKGGVERTGKSARGGVSSGPAQGKTGELGAVLPGGGGQRYQCALPCWALVESCPRGRKL